MLCMRSYQHQKLDDKWVKIRMEMDIDRNWYLVDAPYIGDLEYVRARI